MESDEEQARVLSWMKKKIEDLENEIIGLKATISLIEKASAVKGETQQKPVSTEIKEEGNPSPPVAQPVVEKSSPKPPQETAQPKPEAAQTETPTTQITIGEKKVAAIFQHDNEIKIDVLVPLNQDTPPFKSFFVEKVLRDYEKKDKLKEQQGQIPTGQGLSYDVSVDEDNNIKQIWIRNVNDPRRTREIISTIRWTMARMIEKENK
ncbi:MAG: hypothetical protein RXR41_02630 [Candidatus Marsarchaeota archaeon]